MFFKKGKLREKNKKEFENIMKFANDIIKYNRYALIDVVKALLYPLQYKTIIEPIVKGEHETDNTNYFNDFFWNDREISIWTNMKIKSGRIQAVNKNTKFILDLKKDIIISTPWNKDRLRNALSNYGAGKNKIQWKEDDNHRVETWLPWGISIVDAGNHSIAAGIISGDGQLEPDRIYNISGIFERVKCNGENYIDIITNKAIFPVTDVNTAGVFEIGRLMINNNISAWPDVNFAKEI